MPAATISVINYKGGVGKTTTTLNLGAGLARHEKRVLLVDADPQTNLTLSILDYERWRNQYADDHTLYNFFNRFIDGQDVPPLKDIVITENHCDNGNQLKNLHLISSHLRLINVDLELAATLSSASTRQHKRNFLRTYSLFARGLAALAEDYDVILIDCPPNFGIVTKNAVAASQHVLIPARPDYLSTFGISELNAHLGNFRKDYNQYQNEFQDERFPPAEAKILGVVFTMVRMYGGQPIAAQQGYIAQVQRLKLPIFDTWIRHNDRFQAVAPETGIPVILFPGSAGPLAELRDEYWGLSKELLTRL